MTIRWKGANRQGEPILGVYLLPDVEDWIKRKAEAGWEWLEVFDEDRLVGGVGIGSDGHPGRWWLS